MSYTKMSSDEVQSFLRAPARPALLATTRADGRPHLVPVWYDLDDDGTLLFNCGDYTVKGRNMARDRRVALCVQDDQPPFSFVSISGTAELIDDLDQVSAWASRIGGRYMGTDRAEEFGARNAAPGELVVRVTPDHVVAYRDVAD